MTHPTVKARERPGSGSHELTIPADYRDEYDVNKGDVFRVEAKETSDGTLKLTYTRVYQQPQD